jgi:subtilisin family serine protease
MTTQTRLLALSATLGLLGGCDPEPGPPLPENDAPLPTCAPEDLLNGSILASRAIVRTNGKPSDEHIFFSSQEGEALCVVIVTDHEDGKAAPASITIDLDDTALFSPADFNAAPTHLARKLDVTAGDHQLTVQLRGKPGGRAVVSVFSAPASSPASPTIDPLVVTRLEDPLADGTIVMDEAIVVTQGLASEADFYGALAVLPFPAFVLSRLQNLPIYRVYLPGANGGDDLSSRIATLNAVSSVTSAGVHRVGGIDVESLPKQGDDDYITHINQVHDFSEHAWHLRRINAGRAWTWMDMNANITARTVVMDNGFNVQHPELAGNQGQCWTLVGNVIASGACDAGDLAMPADAALRHHGTAVFGMTAAQGGNTAIDHANAVGVIWNGAVDLASFRTVQIVQEDNSVIDLRGTNFSIILTAEQIALGPDGAIGGGDDRQIINMSFGYPPFDDNADLNIEPADLLVEIGFAMDMWQQFVDTYDDMLLVVAAGNNGENCPGPDDNDELYCMAQAMRTPCVLADTSDHVLCVRASDINDEVWPGSNRGSLFAAPGAGMSVLSYDGPALLENRDGTSYAAPLVAGAAALLRTLYPSLTPGEVHDVLIDSAVPIEDGVGRLDIARAIQHLACGDNPPIEQHCPTFYDLKGHWAAGPVHKLACDCVIEGYDDGRFGPQDSIKREEALKIILILSQPGLDFSPPAQSPFPDVPAAHWYSGYVHWARTHGPGEHGLLDAWIDGNNHFNPGTPVPRGAFVRLLVEAAGISDEPEFAALAWAFEQYEGGAGPEIDYDDENTPSYLAHANHINAATSRCVVSGYVDSDNFGPDDILLRSEAAKIACLANYGLNGGCGAILDEPCEPFGP